MQAIRRNVSGLIAHIDHRLERVETQIMRRLFATDERHSVRAQRSVLLIEQTLRDLPRIRLEQKDKPVRAVKTHGGNIRVHLKPCDRRRNKFPKSVNRVNCQNSDIRIRGIQKTPGRIHAQTIRIRIERQRRMQRQSAGSRIPPKRRDLIAGAKPGEQHVPIRRHGKLRRTARRFRAAGKH